MYMMMFHLIYNLVGMSHFFLVQDISEDYFYNHLLFPLIYFHSAYFLGESIHEYLTTSNKLFIAHHLAAVTEIGILYISNPGFTYLVRITELFAFLELSTFTLNVRTTLKDNNLLYNDCDLCLLLSYGYIRGVIFPYYIYNHLSSNIICSIIPSIIYLMSMLWVYFWYISWNNKRIQINFERTIKQHFHEAFEDRKDNNTDISSKQETSVFDTSSDETTSDETSSE